MTWVAVVPSGYVHLVSRFVAGDLGAAEFSELFVDMFKADDNFYESSALDVLNDIFYACEDYCGDDEIRDGADIDEVQLRQKAQVFLLKAQGVEG